MAMQLQLEALKAYLEKAIGKIIEKIKQKSQEALRRANHSKRKLHKQTEALLNAKTIWDSMGPECSMREKGKLITQIGKIENEL